MGIDLTALSLAKQYTNKKIGQAELGETSLDTTLTKSGFAADAKAVGDAINDINANTVACNVEINGEAKTNVADALNALAMTECGDSDTPSVPIYVQSEEPEDAPAGAIWYDTDDELPENKKFVNEEQMKDYVEKALANLPAGGSDKLEYIGEFNVGDEDVAEWWITEDAEGKPIELKQACYIANFKPSALTTTNTNVIFGNPAFSNPFQSNAKFFQRAWLTKAGLGGEVHVKHVPIDDKNFAMLAWVQHSVLSIAWSAGYSIGSWTKNCLAGLAMRSENSETGLIGANSTVKIWGVRI